MQRHGWTLLFHEGLIEQLHTVQAGAVQASESEPQRLDGNANAKLFQALSHWVMDAVPGDPSRDAFRHCNIAEPAHSNWRCAKIGRRFRLFFRYDARAKVIVFAALKDWAAVMAASRKRSDALSSRIGATSDEGTEATNDQASPRKMK